MTSPARTAFVVDKLEVTDASPVLIRRTLHIAVASDLVCRFGDNRWDLAAAVPDRHSAGQAICWDIYPAPFVEQCKLYVFALANVLDDAPRLPYARSKYPSIKTIQGDLQGLRAFADWLNKQGLQQFSQATEQVLDRYYHHISDQTASNDWKRCRFLAVQRLHAYRDFLPAHCQLPEGLLWGGATAAELAESSGPWGTENRTKRIAPDVMEILLSAALLTIDTIAADLLPAARALIQMRGLACSVAPDIRRGRTRDSSEREINKQQAACMLTALKATGGTLPGRRENGTTVLDVPGTAIGFWLHKAKLLEHPQLIAQINASGLTIKANLVRVARFRRVEGRPWHRGEMDAAELVTTLRVVRAACFLVIAYLSGVRTGEVLNLQRRCITRDPKLKLIFMSGIQMKASDQRRERSPQTIPWVVTEQTARAVMVLQELSPGSSLFPPGHFYSEQWHAKNPTRTRTPGSTSADLTLFIDWFNQSVAPFINHPVIPADPAGPIEAPRLRRTLAWHIVRRPGGLVAGSTQYGHVGTQIMQGYAGMADAGFRDELSYEELLARAEAIYEDHQRLLNGEHVSGPAAATYRDRVAAGAQFAGMTITTSTQVNHALANDNLQIHHGELLTCVYRHATAACRDPRDADVVGPAWPRCRLTCSNIARTDRDIHELSSHVHQLQEDLSMPGMPAPLQASIQRNLDGHTRAIAEHDAARQKLTSQEPRHDQ
ncbi:hypothetical protein ACZ91_35330 [Streptomyces regensis]|nr:hypothetical protein ACZ91_35330 [Streptomyces regensis]